MRTITAIMGDGIGPEVMESAMRVVDATGVQVKWERVLAGMMALNEKGSPLPQETLDSISRNRVALKGPCDTPIGGGFDSVNVALRKHFDLYANIRPVKSMLGVKSRYENVDIVVFRENIEDVYGETDKFIGKQLKYSSVWTSCAQTTGYITEYNSRRFFQQVFNYALKNNHRKATIVHKANILKNTHGLFLSTGKQVFEKYPALTKNGFVLNDMIVDNTAQKLVLDPTRFDIIATTNMFGDILSDLCAGLVGGLGLAPGANIGDDCAIFEAVHGTAPDIAGKDIANPTALILSAAMMLDYIGEPEAAVMIKRAVEYVIVDGRKVTRDINPFLEVGTEEMTDEIVFVVRELVARKIKPYRDPLF